MFLSLIVSDGNGAAATAYVHGVWSMKYDDDDDDYYYY